MRKILDRINYLETKVLIYILMDKDSSYIKYEISLLKYLFNIYFKLFICRLTKFI